MLFLKRLFSKKSLIQKGQAIDRVPKKNKWAKEIKQIKRDMKRL